MSPLSTLFFKGLFFGMTMAIIPGPIFFLIIQRTLAEGSAIGFFCGLGSVTADALFALIAAIGVTFITHSVLEYQVIIALVGGIFLIYLGLTTFFRKPIFYRPEHLHKKNLFTAWLSTFLLTATNPVTIVSYTVIFAALGVGSGNALYTLTLVIGVITGALSTVVGLVSFLRLFHQKVSVTSLIVINKIAGSLLICFGIAALVKVVL